MKTLGCVCCVLLHQVPFMCIGQIPSALRHEFFYAGIGTFSTLPPPALARAPRYPPTEAACLEKLEKERENIRRYCTYLYQNNYRYVQYMYRR
jgi:hypothetical protein